MQVCFYGAMSFSTFAHNIGSTLSQAILLCSVRFQSTYFVMVSDIHTHLTRWAKDYRVTFSRTNIHCFLIKTTGPNIWNDLPSHLRDASNLYSFKKLLRTTLLNPN